MPNWDQAPIVQHSPAWESAPVVNETGTRTEEAMRRAGYTSRRQELENMSFGDRVRNDLNIIGGNVVAAGRGAVKGAASLVAPFYDAAREVGNIALPGRPFNNNYIAEVDQAMTDIGVPATDTASEQGIENLANFGTGVAGGGYAGNAVARTLGVQPQAVNAPTQGRQAVTATNAPARVLQEQGIPLDRSQATGGRFAQMLRRAVSGHPFTAGRQAEFGAQQQRAFNRAVLRSIGINSDEATQGAMAKAKQTIGSMFDDIGKKGVAMDDTLSNQLDDILNEAPYELSDDAMRPLERSIEALRNGIRPDGSISGNLVIQTRRRLSNLSRRPDVGEHARKAHDALLDALERTHPGQREALSTARDQWRNMRLIERAISKDANGNISPSLLANQMFTNQNRAMTVYGQGGDQNLVSLATAGKALPPQLADSGTPSGTMMNATLRSIATAPIYRAGQNWLLRTPGAVPAGTGPLRPVTTGAGASFASRLGLETTDPRSDRR